MRLNHSNTGLTLLAVALALMMPHDIAAQAPPVLPAAPPGDAAAKPAPKEKLPTSLFFTAEERARIRAAMAEHERLKNVKITAAENKAEDYLNQLTADPTPPQPQETVYVYPQFFLESLVYHQADDWVVVVNRQRFSARYQPEDSELSILSVDNEKVLFEWRPKNMERVNETWSREKNDDVLFDTKFGKVIFTLHPNQTFSSYVMRVLEGKVVPVMVDLRTGGAPALPPPPEEAPAVADEEPTPFDRATRNITTEDIQSNVGLKALDKTYKRIGLGDE